MSASFICDVPDDRVRCEDCRHLDAEKWCRREKRYPVLYVKIRCSLFEAYQPKEKKA